jgi:hypothetical protein
MEKGYYKLKGSVYVKLSSTLEIVETFNEGLLFQHDGYFMRKVEYLDTYDIN